MIDDMDSIIIFITSYAVIAAFILVADYVQRKRSSEKHERYVALPLKYRSFCYVVIVPVGALSIVFAFKNLMGTFVGLSFVCTALYAYFEIICVKWYKANGYM